MNEAEREDGGEGHGEFLAEVCFIARTHQMRKPLQHERHDGEETEEAAGEKNEDEGPVDGARFGCGDWAHRSSLMEIGSSG